MTTTVVPSANAKMSTPTKKVAYDVPARITRLNAQLRGLVELPANGRLPIGPDVHLNFMEAAWLPDEYLDAEAVRKFLKEKVRPFMPVRLAGGLDFVPKDPRDRVLTVKDLDALTSGSEQCPDIQLHVLVRDAPDTTVYFAIENGCLHGYPQAHFTLDPRNGSLTWQQSMPTHGG